MRRRAMRFWKIEDLKSELASGDLPQLAGLQYFACAGALAVLLYGLPLYDENRWDVANTIGDALLILAGGYLAYRANGGTEGRDFLGRFVSIGWVLGIRLLVLLMIPVICFEIALEAYFLGDIPENTTPVETIVLFSLSAFYYWRLAMHIDDVARRAAA
jgi:hypothetical protein